MVVLKAGPWKEGINEVSECHMGWGVLGPVATGGSPRGQSRTSQPGPFLPPQREAGQLGSPSLEAQGRAVGSRGPALLQYYWGRD